MRKRTLSRTVEFKMRTETICLDFALHGGRESLERHTFDPGIILDIGSLFDLLYCFIYSDFLGRGLARMAKTFLSRPSPWPHEALDHEGILLTPTLSILVILYIRFNPIIARPTIANMSHAFGTLLAKALNYLASS